MSPLLALLQALEGDTRQKARVAALRHYLRHTPAPDAAWGLYLLAGGKPRQLVPTAVLRRAALQGSGLPDWLFEDCYAAVGDLAETIALVWPRPAGLQTPAEESPALPAGLAACMDQCLLPLRGRPPEVQTDALVRLWTALARAQADAGQAERAVWLAAKLVTGHLRTGVAAGLVRQALAEEAGVPPALMAQRLMTFARRDHLPGTQDLAALLAPADPAADTRPTGGSPYPFFLAQPWPRERLQTASLQEVFGPLPDWQVEWKWDGIRAQWVGREGTVCLWSRGEELITPAFPELAPLARALPAGTVLDGELLVWPAGAAQPAAFNRLQQRLGRTAPGAAVQRADPVLLMAYDLLEDAGQDCRALPQAERRRRLEARVQEALRAQPGLPLRLSPLVQAPDWATLARWQAQARQQGAEGLMLKAGTAPYGVGRSRAGASPGQAPWWKWKLDPLTVDAVLLYAQAGHGRRANLHTDYTFGVWVPGPPGQPRQLVPVAKAYSGLTDAEVQAVDRWVRQHTQERFGPVRRVAPVLVFELAFEGLGPSPRHKAGLALRFPRILRWRQDKTAEEADTLDSLRALMP
ncbi:ATP-dependent DNA ligase [Ideonella livida]|uniref:DNA ligase (ATP) n=1 Tax=Ideonella livida TaxID=2707176 RepID=A0A7C9PI85_9BURK|nr:ATP-dependent DNA ligase [Ideonella livida]NDY92576.1 ATP-dependent DNA ligase [Ideonella livida]